uniref:Putative ovule protein n=1 Tax=Solanum chacoense TaxID=4108 RepID=A0A0V0HVZ5_SOLCH
MGTSISVNLPKNWYVSDNFLGFAVCYSGYLNDCITAHLIPLCDDGMSSMTQKFALSNHSQYSSHTIEFLLVPLGGLWDASNANEKTPNDYGCIKLDVFGEEKEFGVRLLYKTESELDFIDDIDDDFGETDDSGEKVKFGVRLLYKDESELCIRIRKSRYEEEASCSKKHFKLSRVLGFAHCWRKKKNAQGRVKL